MKVSLTRTVVEPAAGAAGFLVASRLNALGAAMSQSVAQSTGVAHPLLMSLVSNLPSFVAGYFAAGAGNRLLRLAGRGAMLRTPVDLLRTLFPSL